MNVDDQKGAGRPQLPRWLIGLAGTIGLAIAIFIIKPMLHSEATSDASPSASIWAISTTKDTMTDASRSVASTVLRGQHYNFELHVTCGSDGLLRYDLNAFDPENKPAPLRAELTDSAVAFVPFQVRVDQAPASDQRLFEPKFNNQIFVQNRAQIVGNHLGLTYNDVDLPGRIAQGRKIAFRLPVAGGDETISFEQTDPALRKMLEPCLPTSAPGSSGETQTPNTTPTRDAGGTTPSETDYYNEAKRNTEQNYRHLPPHILTVLSDEEGANELCRGSSDPALIAKWCPIRDRLVTQLKSMGMCFGRSTDASAADSDWHLCNES